MELTDADEPGRKPGTYPIGIATALLALIAAGLFCVSVAAQYQYLLPARHGEKIPAAILAGALDALMITFSLLAYGMSRAGKPARIERTLIMVCGLASAGMNLAEADIGSPRSVLAYVVAPIALAVTIDRLISVIYRWTSAKSQRSAWGASGRAVLYLLRFILDPWPTAVGVRRMVLSAAPVPGARPMRTRAASAGANDSRDSRGDGAKSRARVRANASANLRVVPPANGSPFAGLSQADTVRAAIRETGADRRAVHDWLAERGTELPMSRIDDVILRDRGREETA